MWVFGKFSENPHYFLGGGRDFTIYFFYLCSLMVPTLIVGKGECMKKLLFVIFLGLLSTVVSAQEITDTLTVFFRKGSAVVDRSFMNNGERAEAFFERVSGLQNVAKVSDVSLEILGEASPEGPMKLNEMLSDRRMHNTRNYLKRHIELPSVNMHVGTSEEDWNIVIEEVERNPQVPNQQQVLEIIRKHIGEQTYQDNISPELRAIDGGVAFEYINKNIFPRLRACRVTIVYDLSVSVEEVLVEEEDLIEILEDEFVPVAKDTLSIAQMPYPAPDKFLKIKANGLGWGIGQMNVAAEFAFAEHFSVAVPFYYSGGFDYFKSTIKFRGIVVQPEFRYYFKPENEGFYAGAHMGVGWYNFALNGDYRIQDHNGNRPAWGGGLGFGYVMQFKKAPAWGLEFALGAGVYDAKYDTFYNEDNGPIAEQGVRKVFVGVDNAAVSVTYKFDFKKGGRK